MNWPEQEKIAFPTADARSELLMAFQRITLAEAYARPIREVSFALMYKMPEEGVFRYMHEFWRGK